MAKVPSWTLRKNDMPAVSKAQQRFFGMVRATQKGEMQNPSSEVAQAASSMSKSDVKKFAKTKHDKLPEKKEVKDLIWKEIVKANEKTSSLEIRKFRMIPKELDHEDGELTATQKIKRNVLMEQFSDLIEEMYS